MNLFVLTGAGLSAESGLATFRQSQDALWARYDPYKLATPEAFARDPALVHDFYNDRRRAVLAAEPNEAHRALARLAAGLQAVGSQAEGVSLFLCTQNVDDLHERGGSERVTHMHGQLLQARCVVCRAVAGWRVDLDQSAACPSCGERGRMRPDVVWFGEMPLAMDQIARALHRADLFVAIGTSGTVYPAAGFGAEARAADIPTAEINLEPSQKGGLFDAGLYGPATQTVPRWVDAVLALPPKNHAALLSTIITAGGE